MNKTLESTVAGFKSRDNMNETQNLDETEANNQEKKTERPKSADKVSTYSIKEKKKMIGIYKDMDMNYFKPKAGKMFSFIDAKKEKIRSNANINYNSTSMNEVFEIRDKEKERTNVKQVNNFIAIQEVDNDDNDSSEFELPDIKPVWEPYQLKCTY